MSPAVKASDCVGRVVVRHAHVDVEGAEAVVRNWRFAAPACRGERGFERPAGLEAAGGDSLEEVALTGLEVCLDGEPALAVVARPGEVGIGSVADALRAE